MKTKKWIIAAICFILSGCIIFTCIMNIAKWDFTILDTTEYKVIKSDIEQEFKNISINTNEANIVFMKDDTKCSVLSKFPSVMEYTVIVQAETLKIEIKDTRKWYERLSLFSFKEPRISVALPQDKYDLLIINTSTGDIDIPKHFTFDNVDIKTSTGDINCQASVTNDLKIAVSTGQTTLENISAGNIELKASTGDTYLTNVNCNSLISSANTGDIELENVDAGKRLSITRSTGDIEFERCDADEIIVNTDTGDVEGSLLSSKNFTCNTDTGKVDIPTTTEGGNCEITSNTGDIEIEIID